MGIEADVIFGVKHHVDLAGIKRDEFRELLLWQFQNRLDDDFFPPGVCFVLASV